MPKLDGLQVPRRLRSDEQTRDIPVIALTAHAMRSSVEEALASGFDAVLTKPCPPQERRRLGGLGLGLAISKAVLELHGGSLTAASGGRGQGATFTARLPLYGGLDAGAIPGKDEGAPQAPPADPGARPLRILLVEDHADTAGAMAELLRSWGHSVVMVDAVAAALEVLLPTGGATGSGEARPPDFDLVISDLGLPDGSGLDVMRQASLQGLPGIALSGYGTQEDVRQSREAGFRVHVTKPASLEALKKAIGIATA